jgi:hypothetical protein
VKQHRCSRNRVQPQSFRSSTRLTRTGASPRAALNGNSRLPTWGSLTPSKLIVSVAGDAARQDLIRSALGIGAAERGMFELRGVFRLV